MQLKDYIASNLNDEQTAAALYTDSSSLIIAWAWSWKTRVLTYKIAYLIRWKHVPVERILWVTFTNKAANEMKERLVKLWEDISAQNFDEWKEENEETIKEDQDYDMQAFLKSMQATKTSPFALDLRKLKWIGTFHSIFLKILKEDIEGLWKKFTKSFWILDADDSSKIIKDILKKKWAEKLFKPQEVKAFISTQKNNWRTAANFLLSAGNTQDALMWQIYQEYEKELEKSNSLDFDDLLLLPYLLFKKDATILSRWQNCFDYILVDEAQDTNWIQFELMKMLSWAWSNITLIGDDFQSIYGRRWALMENFLNVKRYWSDIKMFKLQTNYRSKPHIVAAWNHVIKNNKNQYEKTIIANREWNDKIAVFTHNSDVDEAANIIEFIKQMKDKERLKSWWQVAILYRTNSQSQTFESLFIQEGIPYKIYWAFKFFERKEIKDILAYLRIINNPFDSVSIKRVLNIPNRKIWATSMERLEAYADQMGVSLYEILSVIAEVWNVKVLEQENNLKVTPAALTWITDFMQLYRVLTISVKELNPADLINLLLSKINYKEYLLKEEGWSEQAAEERYQNVGQLVNMASKYEFWMSNQNEEVVNSWEDLLRWFLEEVTLMVDTIENADDNSDAIKLMTIHSSKGLEFPAVFIVWVEENIFPLSRSSLDPKELEEERRLMYVAITRARDALFISHANSRMKWGQVTINMPSRFLEEIPEELLKHYDLTNAIGPSRKSNISEWDHVSHKFFWTGYVLEIMNDMWIVRFDNPKFGLRKIELRFLEEI